LSGLLAQRELDIAALDDGSWQSFEWDVTDRPTLDRLAVLGKAVFVVSSVNANNGVIMQIWLDDMTLNACVSSASISGQVREGIGPAADARLLLMRTDSAGTRLLAATTADSAGNYRFGPVPPLAGGASYRVWYVNAEPGAARDTGRLGFWAGPVITSLAEGDTVMLPGIQVADTPLSGTEPHAAVAATAEQPARLAWSGRGIDGERHQLCLYDPQQADAITGLPTQLCGPLRDSLREPLAFELSPASFAAAPGFGFSYGRRYSWYVVTYAGDPRANPNVEYGYSFFERAITLLPAPRAAVPPPTPQPGDPVGGVPDASWTLLIYVAADNALGDPARVPTTARPATQLAPLPALATAYPGINLVSYVDSFGVGGAQLCAYPPGAAPDCRVQAEPNSADPQTLAAFVASGRARYPATHTALLIIAPGQAAGELALDESAPGAPALSRAGLATALGGSAPLDLLIVQAPNFGSLESLRAVAPVARFLVAPSDQVWQLGALDGLVPLLAGAGRGNPAAAARGAVGVYQAALDTRTTGRALSIAAYDLSRVDGLAQQSDALANALSLALASDEATMRPILEAARQSAQSYDSSGNGRHDLLSTSSGVAGAEEDVLVELRDLAARLRDAGGVPVPVHEAAVAVVTRIDTGSVSPVIASVQRSGRSLADAPVGLDAARGLAVFFPSGDRLGGQPGLVQSVLYGPVAEVSRDGPWATMLRSYLSTTLGRGPGGVTEAASGGALVWPTPGGLLRTDLYLPMMGR
jgi:hypothetical protein